MTIEFKMPDAGPDVETVDIANVLVEVGDTVEAGDPVVEVQVEKAVAEIDCSHSGTVEKIHVAEGDTIKVGSVLISLSGDAAGITESSPAASAPAPTETSPSPAEQSAPPVPAGSSGGTGDFLLPSPGDNPAEVVEVMVAEGDSVEEGDVVVLVQTEKAIAELESPYTGKVTKVNIKEDDVVEEGHLLI
ncbi:MAG: biotin/lipoyl-containing protein, partial [Planctomycetaceae bacterium]